MALLSGARLGPYEILAPLGQGGMGEVYRARDTKLNRDVALKVLPEQFARDPERLARFKREAQLLASLNHPNIAAIYGLEESGDVRALVMELVEGPTLAEHLQSVGSGQYVASDFSRTRSGPAEAERHVPIGSGLPLTETLAIARQIADALEAAHEKGVMHRDLKPANIALTSTGQVKVLDFGLAKALDADPLADASNSPTMSLGATYPGMILGTAAYMSPEQAKGRAADKRSDVWAFGCVLYEMLSGKRAFEGEDISDTLAAVLRAEPDWAALPENVPLAIRTLVQRCLAKDRRQRIADISTAQYVLAEPASLAAPAGTPAIATTAAPPRPLWKRAILVAAALVVGAALATGAWWSFRPSTPPPTVTRFSFLLPQGQAALGNNRQFVGMSPDGARMVYMANNRLYLRSIWELEPKAIAGTEVPQGLRSPVFSPDGQSIVFWSGADNTLKRISVSGGAAVTICAADNPLGISWSADGIVFGQGPEGVMRVSPNGGTPERLVTVKAGEIAHGPQVLPGGQAVLFTLATGTAGDRWDKAQIIVQSLKSGERKAVVNGGSDARYLPTGHIVYALGGTLFAVPFDVKRLEVAGGPVPIVEGVQRAATTTAGTTSGSAQFSFSDTGSLVYVAGPTGVSSAGRILALADQKGSSESLKLPPGSYDHPRVSPDGKRIAFGTDDGKEAVVWSYDLAGTSSMRRLTFGGKNRFPIWSADGQRIAFQSDREGDLGIFWQRADGAGTAERLTKAEQGTAHVPESWSPKGDRFLFGVVKGSNFSLWTFSLQDKKAEGFGDVRSTNPINAVFSPDSRWVAYYSNETGSHAIYVQPFPATGAKYQLPKADARQLDHHPVWSGDGKQLFYIPALGALAAVSVTTQPSFAFGNPVAVPRRFTARDVSGVTNLRNYDLTPDGKILGSVDSSEQDQSGNPTTTEFRVVLNWFEELKQRVPAR